MNTCTINTVTANSDGESVTVDCVVTIDGTDYPQEFVIGALDNATILQQVQISAVGYESTVVAAQAINQNAAASDSYAALEGVVIDL